MNIVSNPLKLIFYFYLFYLYYEYTRQFSNETFMNQAFENLSDRFMHFISFFILGTLLHFIKTTMIIKTRSIRPGIIPAAKVCETGTFVRALYKIAAFDGGISASNKAADAASTTTKGVG